MANVLVYQVHEVTDWNLNCPNPNDKDNPLNKGHYRASKEQLLEIAEGGELLGWLTNAVPTFMSLSGAQEHAEANASRWWDDANDCGQFSNPGDNQGEFPGLYWDINPDLANGREGFTIYKGTIRGWDEWHWLCRIQMSELVP